MPEIREPIARINQMLIDEYGKFEDGRPLFRVVWSEDQYEKRWTEYTDEGFKLLQPEVRLLPKYKQWMQPRFVLERLVPTGRDSDLVDKVSYEPAWVFQDRHQNYLPPYFEGCAHVVESIFQAAGRSGSFAKYKDPLGDPEAQNTELNKTIDLLFGNETDTGDALAHGAAIVSAGDGSGNAQTLRESAELRAAETPSKLTH